MVGLSSFNRNVVVATSLFGPSPVHFQNAPPRGPMAGTVPAASREGQSRRANETWLFPLPILERT